MSNFSLLSVNNDGKTTKGLDYGYLTGVLYLAPAESAGLRTLCPMSADCEDFCLWKAGRGRMPTVEKGRINRARFYISETQKFLDTLARDIDKLIPLAESEGLIPCVRPNGTSDETKLAEFVYKRYPTYDVYDYTKIPRPWERTTDNYHLTFSYNTYEKGLYDNWADCIDALSHGINVAVPFDIPKSQPLPKFFRGIPVIDGDLNDLRFLDPVGVIVGLRYKKVKDVGQVGFLIEQQIDKEMWI